MQDAFLFFLGDPHPAEAINLARVARPTQRLKSASRLPEAGFANRHAD